MLIKFASQKYFTVVYNTVSWTGWVHKVTHVIRWSCYVDVATSQEKLINHFQRLEDYTKCLEDVYFC